MQPIEVLKHHHLETSDGRIQFLTEELTPYALKAEDLNQQITVLAEQIKTLDPEADKEQILSLSNQVAEKMDLMNWILPSLDLALHVEKDLNQIEPILSTEESLTPEQQEIVDRISSLCLYIDEFNRE
jgi:hypothetical protein